MNNVVKVEVVTHYDTGEVRKWETGPDADSIVVAASEVTMPTADGVFTVYAHVFQINQARTEGPGYEVYKMSQYHEEAK